MRGAAARRLAIAAIALAMPAAAERIRSFDVFVDVHADGTLAVEERIRWDFEGASKHGIYREIPIVYERPGSADFHIGLRVDRVSDANATPWPVYSTTAGGYARIRIGDPARTLTGVQDYWIRYRVTRAVLFFDDHDELYWNATGDEWQVPIDHAAVHVTIPPVGDRDVRLACYTGPVASRARACDAVRAGERVDVVGTRAFPPREGMTVVVGLPKGIVAEPTALQRARGWLEDTGGQWLLLPVGILVAMWLLWRVLGRDPKIGDAIAVRYEPPPGLTPAEVGTIFDEFADLDDVTSTILDLAIRGWLRIEETAGERLLFFSRSDYRLVRLPDPPGQTLKAHETELLAGLFDLYGKSVLVSQLRERFYTHLAEIQRALYTVLSREGGFFAANPERVRQAHVVVGMAVGLSAFIAYPRFGPLAAASVAVSGVVIALMGHTMPRRTRKGREAYEHIAGLREFIGRVEADRLERLGGKTAGTFEKILPFAVVLGVADRWADAFAGIYATPPSWYTGSSTNGRFEPHDLVRTVGRSLDTMGRTLASRPSSRGSGSSGFSSSGSSGGGFGGGGGGSW
jgi:uncharacterized membrane protein YgcG